LNWSKKDIKKIVLVVGGLMVFYTGLQNIESVWKFLGYLVTVSFPFILGAAIAFIINVPMRSIEKLLFPKTRRPRLIRARRPLALVFTIIAIIGILFLAVVVVIPQITGTITDVGRALPGAIEENWNKIEKLLEDQPRILEFVKNIRLEDIKIDWEGLVNEVVNYAKNGAGMLVNSGISIVSSIVSSVVSFFIAFVFAIYILVQKEKLASQATQIVRAYASEKVADKIIEIAGMSERVFAKFLAGQCLEAVILGVMFTITMSIIRLPYALTVGVIIAITALVPIVGAFVGCFIGAFLILVESPVKALIFVIMFLILQQIEGNLIYPYVVGGTVGLPSIWVLAAVTIGGNLFGVVGMIIFIPICSVVYTLFRTDVKRRLAIKRADSLQLGAAVIQTDALELNNAQPDELHTERRDSERVYEDDSNRSTEKPHAAINATQSGRTRTRTKRKK
jgi:predicted PurR-regulated permease PerM